MPNLCILMPYLLRSILFFIEPHDAQRTLIKLYACEPSKPRTWLGAKSLFAVAGSPWRGLLAQL